MINRRKFIHHAVAGTLAAGNLQFGNTVGRVEDAAAWAGTPWAESLRVQLADDFRGPELDLTRWQKGAGGFPGDDLRVENGRLCMRAATTAPPAPGLMPFSGIATRSRQFNPNLSGVNLLEVTLDVYLHSEELVNKYLTLDGHPTDKEDPFSGLYMMGFCLAIGNFPGLIGSERDPAKDRVVQIHFDWYSKFGLWFCLNRNIIPGDAQKYPKFDRPNDMPLILEKGYEAFLQRKPVFITPPAVALKLRRDPVRGNPVGHRYGLKLADDANTLSWTLDGKAMDSVDITGFFGSSPGCVRQGAYASLVGGGSYRTNCWKLSEVRISTSRSGPPEGKTTGMGQPIGVQPIGVRSCM